MGDLDSILSDEIETEEQQVEEAEELNGEAADAEAPEKPEAEEPEAEAAKPTEADTRDREIAGLKAALAETRGEMRALKSQNVQPAPPPPKAPDMLDDPQGYNDFVQSQIGVVTQNVKLDLSEENARDKHGDEIVDAAFAAFQDKEDPALRQSIMSSRSPWNELVKWHQREALRAEIGDDPEAWKKQQAAAIRAEIQAELDAKRVAENVTQLGNAPSLASEPNLGGRGAPGWSGPASLDSILSS